MALSINRWTNTDKFIGIIYDFSVGPCFNKHLHSHRYEAWHVLSGAFKVTYMHEDEEHEIILEEGESWDNKPLELHALECIEAGTLLEVATHPNLNEKTINFD